MLAPEDLAELRKAIGDNIRRRRVEKQLSQQELADRCGVSRKHINRIEAGESEPGASVLYLLSDALDVSSEEFRKIPLHVA